MKSISLFTRETVPTRKDVSKKVNKLNSYVVKAMAYLSNAGMSRANRFYRCDYDLDLIKEAINTDSYLKVAIQKNMQLFFKAGYTLRSDNDKASRYIESRFRLMSHCTKQSSDILWKDVAYDLECYSNAFLVKTRVDEIPFMNAKGITNSCKPVGGYFRVDPSTMSVKYDANGYISKYKQKLINGIEKDFSPNDIVHFTYDREAGSVWGIPRLIAALEDVKLLRVIEGNIISMIYRFAIPLLHLKIGSTTAGMGGTKKEVEDAKYEIEHSPMDGIYVSTERAEFKAVGAEGSAIDAKGYLEYFENRVFSVLNMSQATMGRGGSKQDADSMEEQAHNKIKNDQALFSAQFEAGIINELLLEGGFDPITDSKDVVKFVFNEVNVDTKVKLENHEMTKYTANLITFDEARHNIGLKSDNVDESRLYANLIDLHVQKEEIAAQGESAIALARVTASVSNNANTGSGSSSSSYTKKNTGNGKITSPSSGGKKTAQSKNTPSNQHGTYSAKIKESYDRNSSALKEKISLLCNKYDTLRNCIIDNDEANKAIDIYKEEFSNIIKSGIEEQAFNGSNEVLKALNDNSSITGYFFISPALSEYVDSAVETLINDIRTKVEKNKNIDNVKMEADINAMKYRLEFLADFSMNKAYWYSYAKTAHKCGVKEIKINSNSKTHGSVKDKVINTGIFDLNDIPGYSSGCTCSLMLSTDKNGGEKI